MNDPETLTHDYPAEEKGAKLIAGGEVRAFGRNEDGVSLFVQPTDGGPLVEVSMHAPAGIDVDYIRPEA